MSIERHNPAGLYAVPDLISQLAAPRDADLVFLSGQVAWDEYGELQGVGDHVAQASRIAANLDIALASLGVRRDAIVKETIYIVHWAPALLPSIMGTLRDGSPAPASTLIGVAALVHPDALIEVECVVAIPRSRHTP